MNADEMVNEKAVISKMSVSTCWKIDVRKYWKDLIDAHEVVISLAAR